MEVRVLPDPSGSVVQWQHAKNTEAYCSPHLISGTKRDACVSTLPVLSLKHGVEPSDRR